MLAVSMLAHRFRRWPNIETAVGECPVFAGYTTVMFETASLRRLI